MRSSIHKHKKSYLNLYFLSVTDNTSIDLLQDSCSFSLLLHHPENHTQHPFHIRITVVATQGMSFSQTQLEWTVMIIY